MKIKVFQNSQIENILVSKLIKPGFRLEKTGKHKKGKKCCGLLLLLSTMLGLSLNVCSDTSALKYAYNAFNISDRLFYQNCSGNSCSYLEQPSHLSFNFSSDSSPFNSELLSLDSNYLKLNCSSENSTKFNIWNTTSTSFYSSSNLNHSVFGDLNGSIAQNQFTPSCSYSYDSVFPASFNVSTGEPLKLVNIPSLVFGLSNNIHRLSGSLDSISVPLSLNSSLSDSVISGSKFDWELGFVTPDYTGFPYVSSSVSATLYYSYFTANPESFPDSYLSSFVSSSSVCSVDSNYSMQTYDPEMYIPYYGLNFHCSFTAPSDIYFFSSYIYISSSSGRLLDYDYDGLFFTGSYLVTDNDSTWSGLYANSSPTGSDLASAPGYRPLYGTYPVDHGCLEGDFICNLTNLFTFDFINPFAPIFGLFTDQNQCAQIPNLSSMLHSEETEVCPWFDSSTRAIVTPVLGLSSMMLLFGFVVRWLGARSGNFIEDSGGVDSGRFHFQNKFKRGGN